MSTVQLLVCMSLYEPVCIPVYCKLKFFVNSTVDISVAKERQCDMCESGLLLLLLLLLGLKPMHALFIRHVVTLLDGCCDVFWECRMMR